MTVQSNRFSNFWQELKRRKVVKVTIIYASTAFILLQLISILIEPLHLPQWVMTFFVVLLLVGFPIVVILSWIFDITPQGIEVTSSADETGIQKPTVPVRKKDAVYNILIVLLLLVVIILAWPKIFKKDYAKNANSDFAKSIAVLPLKNLNQNEQLEYFSDGVTQEIIDELAKVHQFQLSAFSSTVIYKNSDKSLKEIATELGVSLILAGSSRIYGDNFRLSIELINPKSNKRIWGKQYDDVLSNAIKIQNDIAKRIAQELNIELSPEEKIDLNKLNTSNHEAFDLLLQAKSEYTQLTKQGFTNSINMLERALELDPDYTQAYTLLAWVHLLHGNAEIMSDAENAIGTVKKAQPLIEKAISLDPSNSDNYLIMGNMYLFYLNDLQKAVQNVNRALEMNSWPKVPTNYCICTAVSTFTASGDLNRATEIVKLSKKIDPSNVFVYGDEGIILLLKDKPEQAIYSFKQALEYLDIPAFNFILGWAYYHLSEYENALLYLDKAITGEAEPHGYAMAFLSNTYFKMGDTKMSNQYRDMLLKKQSSGRANLNIPLAMIYAGQDNTEEALHFLEKALLEKDFGLAWYLNADPVFNKLKNDKVFTELISIRGFE